MTPTPDTRNTPEVAAGTTGTSPRARRRRGPSSTLTPTRIRSICAKIEKGVPQTAAAGALGIPKRTLDNWLKWGRADGAEGIYLDFVEAVDRARSKFHASRAVQVVEHAEKDPRSAMFILERRFPDDWADQSKAGGGVTVNVGLIVESPEWRALSERLLSVLAPFPDALEAVIAELGGGVTVEGHAVELPEVTA